MIKMDVPADQDKKMFEFPRNGSTIVEDMKHLFQLTWKAKSVMETAVDFINDKHPQEEKIGTVQIPFSR